MSAVLDREIAREILIQAACGERIGVIVKTHHESQFAIRDLEDQLRADTDLVRDIPIKITPSNRTVRIGVGRITIHSAGSTSSMRGVSFDRIYLDRFIDDGPLLMHIYPALDATGGELRRF